MDVVVIPNCLCSHAIYRHVAETSWCKARGCHCSLYRPKGAQR